jgi:hypothetical protein
MHLMNDPSLSKCLPGDPTTRLKYHALVQSLERKKVVLASLLQSTHFYLKTQ